MGIEYILFLFYIGFAFWRIPLLGFVKSTTLNDRESRFLFLFKILTGFVAAYYFENISPKSDYQLHNEEGYTQYQLLITDPMLFLSDFRTDLAKYGVGNIFETSNSFWGYFRFHIFYKFLAFQNLITQGNFYLNAALFSSIVFWGQLAFFKLFYSIYNRNKYPLLIVCFCIPSILLFTSVPHKDGLVFLGIAFVALVIYRHLTGTITVKWVMVLVVSLLSILLLRNFILLALLPAILAAHLTTKMKRKPIITVLCIYAAFIAIFFVTGNFNGEFNLPEAVIKRKADFAILEKGNTNLPMDTLKPTISSFIINTPTALNHVLLRPYPFEFNKAATLAAVELYIYLLLFSFFLLKNRKFLWKQSIHPFNIFGLAFSLTMIIIIGLTIPNAGAIVRYRSILWIFLLPPIVCKLWDQFNIIKLKRTK